MTTMVYNHRQAQLYFAEKGIKPSNLGYRYLIACVQLMAEQPRRYINVNVLYSDIAKDFNRNPLSVERAIRYTLRHLDQTNKEFIANMAEALTYEELNIS